MVRFHTDNPINVYSLLPTPDRLCSFAFANPADDPIFRQFDGHPMAAAWKAVPITPADREDNDDVELLDHNLLGIIPIFSVRAVDVLLDLLRPNGELLPLRYARAEYMAYNVTRVIDALDESGSRLTRFKTSGRVQSIQRYSFRREYLEGVSVFKIPQLLKAYVFVTDIFVERATTSHLTGFKFQALWNSSRGGVDVGLWS
jgi:hypothetical protein